MDVETAARAWADTWSRNWPAKDLEAIASLYAGDALYRALVFREPDRGVAGVRRYLAENFAVEEDVECFDGDGRVVDHRDYWNEVERREPPFEGW